MNFQRSVLLLLCGRRRAAKPARLVGASVDYEAELGFVREVSTWSRHAPPI